MISSALKTTAAAVVRVGLLVDTGAGAITQTGRAGACAILAGLATGTDNAAPSTVAVIGLFVDTGTITARLPVLGAITVSTTGTGSIDARLVRRTHLAAGSAVVGVCLRVGLTAIADFTITVGEARGAGEDHAIAIRTGTAGDIGQIVARVVARSTVVGVRLLVDTRATAVAQASGTAEATGAVARTAVPVPTTTVSIGGTAGAALAGLSSRTRRDTDASAGVAREALACVTRTGQRRAVAGAVVTGISDATNRRGGHAAPRTSRATGVAEAFVMGGITDTLTRGRGIVAKDSTAPLGAGVVASQSETTAAQAEQAAKGGSNSFEGLAPRGRSRQGFGQAVKSGRFHCRSLLSPGTGHTSWYHVGIRSRGGSFIEMMNL